MQEIAELSDSVFGILLIVLGVVLLVMISIIIAVGFVSWLADKIKARKDDTTKKSKRDTDILR